MQRALLGLAALSAVICFPASAQSFGGSAFSGMEGGNSFHGGLIGNPPGGVVGNNRGDFRNGRRNGNMAAAYGYAGGYYDYGDYDANRSFDPEKWNDWWHDRPDRAFPRWMSRNQDCARKWYSADVLTC
jgi:hypothetical protein